MINPIKRKVYEILEDINDLELGVDIVNLGLIYEVNIIEEKKCGIVMTMPSRGEILAAQMIKTIKTTLLNKIKELSDITIELVWSPPWTPDKMTRYAQLTLEI